MKRQKRICALLLAVLLLTGLGGCAQKTSKIEQPEDPQPEEVFVPEKNPVHPDVPTPEAEDEAEEPPEEEGVVWDNAHRLEIEAPKVAAGKLELPVEGATGYVSIELPLWRELPEEGEGTLADIEAKLAELETKRAEAQAAAERAAAEKAAAEIAAAEKAAAEAAAAETAELEKTEDGEPSAESTTEDTDPAAVAQEPDGTEEPTSEQPSEETAETPTEDTEYPAPQPETPPIEEATEPAAEPEPEPEPEEEYDPYEDAVAMLTPGTAFTVLQETGRFWLVRADEGTGWVEHRYCLINLPDVVPSMVYHATNSYSSLFVSCGKSLPKVTGCALYPGATYNARLGRREYMMPMLYAMAKDVCQAQQAALAEGNTLVLYEAYRPYETQRAVVTALTALSKQDDEVRSAISDPPWNMSWFIATGYSNHQRGFAMDVSLAKVTRAELQTHSGSTHVHPAEYEEYEMPTPIHELSRSAATFTAPVATFSNTAWRSAELTPAMASNEPALALQRYCTGTGVMTPLSSEWWHFNDLSAREQVLKHLSTGGYLIRECRSIPASDARSGAKAYHP